MPQLLFGEWHEPMTIDDILDKVDTGEWVILSVNYGRHNSACNVLVDRQRGFSRDITIPVDPNMSRETIIRLIGASRDGINGFQNVDEILKRFHVMMWEF